MNRDIQDNDIQKVTNVVAPTANPIAGDIAQFGQQIIATNQAATINQNISSAQLDLQKLNNQYQIANQANPMAGLDDLKKQQQDILDSYGDQISPLFKSQWQSSARELGNKNSLANQAWGLKQTQENSTTAINQTMLNSYQLANNAGIDFGKSPSNDVMSALNYEQNRSNLEDFGNKTIGATSTTNLLSKYKVDYSKAFIAGLAENNPQKAAEVINNPDISAMFTAEQKDDFVSLINKTMKKQQLDQNIQQTVGTSQVLDIVNDPNTNYYQKRLTIDQMELKGQIAPGTGQTAVRVLNSQKAVDTVTSTPIMSGIITKIYDLNATADDNPSDYLKGVSDVHNEILSKQASGDLTPEDATKANNTLRTLTSKKQADATKAVGANFSGANDMFSQLPPEQRGAATRELFNQTYGQDNLTDDQYKQKASAIIDNANQGSRQKALNSINYLNMSTGDLLKSYNYTPAQVHQAAVNKGISDDQVLQLLRQKKIQGQ